MYKNSETILIDCASTKTEQIHLIKTLFSKYGRVWIGKPTKADKTQIECSVDESFSFLLGNFKEFPSWAFQEKETTLNLLAGFIDAEGSFFVTKTKKSSGFSIGNYNKKLLNQTQKQLTCLGITCRLFLGVRKGYKGKDGYAHREDYWILSVYRKLDLFRFSKTIIPYL